MEVSSCLVLVPSYIQSVYTCLAHAHRCLPNTYIYMLTGIYARVRPHATGSGSGGGGRRCFTLGGGGCRIAGCSDCKVKDALIRKRDRTQDPINLKAVAALAGLFAAQSGATDVTETPIDTVKFTSEDRRSLRKMDTLLCAGVVGTIHPSGDNLPYLSSFFPSC